MEWGCAQDHEMQLQILHPPRRMKDDSLLTTDHCPLITDHSPLITHF
jgi:hypothetical protein